MAPGGKGANQAVAAARCGAEVAFVGCLGNDAYGNEALENYRREGIIATHVRLTDEAATAVATITVDATGQNSITVAPGSNFCLTVEDIERARDLIEDADVVLLQLEIPIVCVRRAVDIAYEMRKTIILNPAPAQPLDDETLKKASILTPNESETEMLTSAHVRSVNEVVKAAQILRRRTAATVVLTLGERGAFVSGEGCEELIPTRSVKALDATAAGDVFNGALAVMVAEKKDLREAIRFANAAAALSVTKMGAQPSIPTRKEVENFMLEK